MGFTVNVNIKKSGYANIEQIAAAIRSTVANLTGMPTILQINDFSYKVSPNLFNTYQITARDINVPQNKNVTNLRK